VVGRSPEWPTTLSFGVLSFGVLPVGAPPGPGTGPLALSGLLGSRRRPPREPVTRAARRRRARIRVRGRGPASRRRPMSTDVLPRSEGAEPKRPPGGQFHAPPGRGPARAAISPRTLRKDAWWANPLVTAVVLVGFTAYGIWAAFRDSNYWAKPYLSPFYSPCLTDRCAEHRTPHIFGDLWTFSPAILILIFPLGFRLTCYYYRKAYYRSFWLSPPGCAIAEPHRSYSGESRFPLILQNIHRYFFYFAVIFAALLTYDAVLAFDFPDGIGIGVGTGVLIVNAVAIWLYTLSCHSCRHLCGGGLKLLSKAPLRYRVWSRLSVLNRNHMRFAWASLLWIMVTDFYIWLVAAGHLTDYHWAG
jgi:hypothetical protein